MSWSCPLCQTSLTDIFNHRHVAGPYALCPSCDLISRSPASEISPQTELARYNEHQNSLANSGYREFLMKAALPLMEWSKGRERSEISILDFGSGPTPALAQLLREEGFTLVTCYDPFFSPANEALKKTYDVVISTEVWEHFRCPEESIPQFFSLIRPKGLGVVMTQFHHGSEAFKNWWYPQDKTHRVFYSEKTWRWLAQLYGLRILKCENPVVVLEKNL